MNPIIRAITQHIDNGELPTNFLTAYPQDYTRYGVEVWFAHGRKVIHDVHPHDHNEFFEWFKATSEWWDSPTNPRKQPRKS